MMNMRDAMCCLPSLFPIFLTERWVCVNISHVSIVYFLMYGHGFTFLYNNYLIYVFKYLHVNIFACCVGVWWNLSCQCPGLKASPSYLYITLFFLLYFLALSICQIYTSPVIPSTLPSLFSSLHFFTSLFFTFLFTSFHFTVSLFSVSLSFFFFNSWHTSFHIHFLIIPHYSSFKWNWVFCGVTQSVHRH